MTRTMKFLSTAVAGSLLAFLPTTASAQSWSYGGSYRSNSYNDGYYRDGRRDHWRERRDRWEARQRREREREWRREHRRHHRDWRGYDYRY